MLWNVVKAIFFIQQELHEAVESSLQLTNEKHALEQHQQ